MNYESRRSQIARVVRENQLDGLLVSAPVNVTYLTGFTGDSSYLLVGRNRLVLISDGRYAEQLREECPNLEVHIRPSGIRLLPATAEVMEKLGWRRMGFDSAHLTVSEFSKLKELARAAEWKAGEGTVEKLRMCKDADEVGEIRQAIAMAERAFERFRATLRDRDKEKQLSDRLEMLLREEGAQSGSFPVIVAAGERAALPHAPTTDRPIGECELLLVDWGAAGQLYRSDLTRVLALRKISPKLTEVYEVVFKAQCRAIAKLRPGVKAQDVDAEARAVLHEAGFGEFFSHALGHGIGLEVHEAPGLRPESQTILQPGMVVTVEPGIYIPGWGGVRIEDDVLITPDGCEVLTSVTKELRDVVCPL